MPPSTALLPLSDHRARVERYVRGIASSFTSVARRIIEERLPAPGAGDPVRASLVLWACTANGGDLADALPVAAAFELFDRFMLLHGELADGGAAASRWGLGQTLNAGDAFYALGFRALASDVANPMRRLEAARIVGGAVLLAIERSDSGRGAAPALMEAALKAGAIVGGGDAKVVRAFARAGRLLGAASLSRDANRAQRLVAQAVGALSSHADVLHLHAFERVASYVAQRAA